MAALNAYISIIVYKGEPLDYQMYRHTAIWIRFTDGSPPILIHITGSAGIFEFETREEEKPSGSRRFAKQIDIGYLRARMTSSQIVRVLGNVPIDNRSREFNCQTWIEQALKALVDCGLLSKGEYDVGLDGMVDAIADAEDD